MKLSISKITIPFLFCIGFLVLYVRFYNRGEYQLRSRFYLKDYSYSNELIFKINGAVSSAREYSKYDRILYGLSQNSYDVQVYTPKKQVIFQSPFFKVVFFYEPEPNIVCKQIDIIVHNKSYCEN